MSNFLASGQGAAKATAAEEALDLGCGSADGRWVDNLYRQFHVTGIDIDPDRVSQARANHQLDRFLLMPGERIRDLGPGRFTFVYSNVAIPYMHIPTVLSGIQHILKPGGTLEMSLHPAEFTVQELCRSLPKLKPTLYRLYVLLNGLLFHYTGRIVRLGNRCESWSLSAA
jgi:SAM-dependent methyltransferase